MALNLPPDPYKALGVTKEATLPEIRSAHRKLVLKCHPDKVQDAALKAIKQDEFQQVQQAYELLSDEVRRTQYDEQVKLFELRREMGRGGNPTSRVNPFEFEIRTAEPRPNTYTRPQPTPSNPKVYAQQPPPRSYEDVMFEEPMRQAKKSASYESTEKRRPSTRDGPREADRRKHEDDEILRAKWEKESKRAAHGEKKKFRDKEKRRGTEEKYSRSAYVEDDSDDYRAPPREKKSSRSRIEEDIRMRNEEAAARAAKEVSRKAPLTPKWDGHKEFAAEYMQAARRKGAPTEDFHPGPLRRAETFAATESQKFHIRYATPQSPHMSPISPSDDDSPRRSSARTTSRRVSETPPTRRDAPKQSRDVPKKDHKRSPSTRTREPYIVEPPSPTPPILKTPKLQSHSSAPPIITGFHREKPSRSKTQDYPRQEIPVPPLPRANTFQSGDRDHGRDRDRGGSRLKKTVNYDSESSGSDSPVYASPRHSHSPPPRRQATEPTRYIIDNGRSHPVTSHRAAAMRNIDDEDYHPPRDRSESPRGSRKSDRPALTRSGGSGARQAPQRSHSQAYYPPEPEPVIREARPKMPARESGGTQRGGSGNGSGRGGPYFGEVKYTPNYADHVVYSSPISEGEHYRRGSDPSSHHRDYNYPSRGRGEVYA